MDQTIAFTKSSFTYKDPYQPSGTPIYKMRNKFTTFLTLRTIENEFVDFRSYYLHDHFKQIYQDLYQAYRRRDKVILRRSCSDNMFEWCQNLLKEKEKEKVKNPFFKEIQGLQLMQARMYAESDKLLPEDQWA